MKNTPNIRIFSSPLFLISLFLLFLNDFFLKAQFGNWVTGKLSDFAGLFIFPLFFAAFLPSSARFIYYSTALFFIYWKSEYAQFLLDFLNSYGFPLARTVDYTDYIALLVLPFSYRYFQKQRFTSWDIPPRLVAVLAFFMFCATVIPSHNQVPFPHTKYLLFQKTELFRENVQKNYHIYPIDPHHCFMSESRNSNYGISYIAHDLDSLVLIEIPDLCVSRYIPIEYDAYTFTQFYRKLFPLFTQTLSAQDSFFLNTDTPIPILFSEPKTWVDSMSLEFRKEESIEILSFRNSQLHGGYEKLNIVNNKIKGQYENNVEVGVWEYSNIDGILRKTEKYEQGELVETLEFDKGGKVISQKNHLTRSDKTQFALLKGIVSAFLVLVFSILIIRNNTPSKRKILKPYSPHPLGLFLAVLLISFSHLLLIKFVTPKTADFFPDIMLFWFIIMLFCYYMLVAMFYSIIGFRGKYDYWWFTLVLIFALGAYYEFQYWLFLRE